MVIENFLGLFLFGIYLLADFAVFKYFIHNRKGVIPMMIEKIKANKKIA